METLLIQCLSYEAEERPSAADLVKWSRRLSKEIGGTNLQDWAELHVMDVVRSTVEGYDRFNPMTGRVLSEDQTSVGEEPTPLTESDEGTVQMVQDVVKTLPEMDDVLPVEIAGPPTLEELPSLDSLAFVKNASKSDESWEDEPTRLEDPKKLRQRLEDEENTEGSEDASSTLPSEDASSTLPEEKTADPLPRPPTGGLDASLPLAVPGTSSALAPGVVDGATLLMDESEAGGDVATMMMSEDDLLDLPAVQEDDDAATRLMPEGEAIGVPSPVGLESNLPLQNQASSGETPPAAPAVDIGLPSSASPSPPQGPANAPPLLVETGSPLGSETVFTSIGGGSTGPLEHSDTTVVQRVAASLLVFVIAGVFALGTGAMVFREEIATLFGGSDGPGVTKDEGRPSTAPPSPPPVEPEVPAPDPLEGFDGATVAFESLLDGTERLSVRCAGGISADGVTSVVLSETAVSRCVVTVYPSEGPQLRVITGDIGAGLSQCFADGKKSCGG